MILHREYHAEIQDGEQWVFFLQQDRHLKSVYCNNHFPDEILAFAEFVDATLTQYGLGEVAWERVPESQGRVHEDEFWESITQN